MRAALCKAYGPPDALVVENIAEPVPGPGEASVEVAAAALNFFDLLIIENRYQSKPALPFSPGAEFCGRVRAVGPGVTEVRPGDRVMAFPGHGACREVVVCPAGMLLPVPDGLSDEKAAGLSVTYGTTLHALEQRARLRPGETLAVLGASGGVGLAAVEIGRRMGARVIACASSPEKVAFARAAGAEIGLDYSALDLKEELKRLTEGRGVDVIYDPVGGPLSEQALRAIAWRGRFLVVGFAAGDIPKLALNLVLLKGCDVLGVFWGDFVRRDPAGHRANMARLAEWAASGALSAHVHAVYPLERIGEALGVLARREAQGKVLVRP